jgi:hypothetical protein
MATIHLQDFRDIEGDYKTHAITIPIILSSEGRMKLRKATAFALLTGVVLSGLWICIRGQHASAMLTGLVFYLSSGVLDFYTVISRSRHQDRIVYRWWMVTGLCVIVLFLSCSCWRRRHFDGIGHRKRLRLSKINLPANEIPRDKLSWTLRWRNYRAPWAVVEYRSGATNAPKVITGSLPHYWPLSMPWNPSPRPYVANHTARIPIGWFSRGSSPQHQTL